MVSGTLFGATIGLGIQMFSNSVRHCCLVCRSLRSLNDSSTETSRLLQLRKVPLMRDPWEHVLLIGLGAWAGSSLTAYEVRTAMEIEELLEKRKHLEKERGAR